ncbi:hypothetical protein [Amycolatopsis vancoresmycina]|uniref:hypothetical protein n=1 Tax=Amycolatopsis vancoresmycina TaxID=208444 RepID=UPI0009DC1BC6|nr:hypothetical protein [Amycolatopsis vancoresmycina]
MRAFPWIAVAAAFAVGCAGPGPATACPAIGYVTGISLTIPAPAGITRATLDACWRGQCVNRPVDLTPETTAGASTCVGTGPDSSCGAPMVPTGGLHGFAEVPGLPAEPVRITVRFDDGKPHTADVTPAFSEPNGPACGKAGPQVQLLVGPDRELSPV